MARSSSVYLQFAALEASNVPDVVSDAERELHLAQVGEEVEHVHRAIIRVHKLHRQQYVRLVSMMNEESGRGDHGPRGSTAQAATAAASMQVTVSTSILRPRSTGRHRRREAASSARG
jgi:hypothetical protein